MRKISISLKFLRFSDKKTLKLISGRMTRVMNTMSVRASPKPGHSSRNHIWVRDWALAYSMELMKAIASLQARIKPNRVKTFRIFRDDSKFMQK